MGNVPDAQPNQLLKVTQHVLDGLLRPAIDNPDKGFSRD